MTTQQKTITHTAFKALPIVDISLLSSENLDDRKQVANDLDKATREAGFLYLKGHPVPNHIIEDLKASVKDYFAQSIDEKMRHYIGLSENHSGYVPKGEEQFYSGQVDLKEGYDVSFESSSLLKKFYPNASNQWPENADFKHAVKAYYEAIFNLSKMIFSAFALALNLPEDFFEQKLKAPPSQLRLLHYFENPNATNSDSGIGAHTDYEFFTLLLPTSPGLQVLNGAGEWIEAPVLDGCFVLNIGDMMEVMSNGHYVATSHRVRAVKAERYSFPYFAALDYETVVEPLEVFCTDKPAAYDRVVCGDHLLAQTMQTFVYLKARQARGEVALPEDSKALGSYGHAQLKEG